MKNRYVDLKTDWGFKYLMGKEPQMRSFLNSLLREDYGEIKSLTFENVEVLSERSEGRGVIFDLLCTTDSGDKIIVEMQNYSHLFFKTRSNYYLYALMAQALNRGDRWTKMKEDIPHLIGIFFLGKRFGDERKPIVETEEFDRVDKAPFWDRMRKYFIILENFDISNVENPSPKDCWIEVIKNLGNNMYKISPSVYEKADPALLELIERANVCNLTDEEYRRYEAGLKALEDYIDFDELLEDAKAEATAKGLTEGHAKGHAEGHAEGLAEGRAEGLAEGIVEGIVEGERRNKLENAKRMLEENFTVEMIAKITKLSKNEIENLKGLI